MLEGIRLGRVAGFPVAVNWSVLVILWLFTWSLASYSLPGAAPGHSLATYWLAGFVGALLLLGSLLAHELAHALTARRAGFAVTGLTLWLFGGVASLRGEAKTPGADFRIAAVGPATSLVLAAAFAGIGTTLDVFGLPGLPVSVVWWLAGTNLLLGVFNLLPGAPLDGGRILRAYLWRRHGDRVRAALGATRAGQVVAFVLIGLGLLEFLAGGGLSGLWLVFLGWFLLSAARMEETEVTTRQRLVGVRVGDVMSLDPRAAPSWLTVEEFIQRYVWGDRHSAYPVTGPDGTVEGLVTLAQLRGVPAEDRIHIRVRDVMIPLTAVPTAAPDEPLYQVMERLTPRTGGRALVLDAGRLVGMVTSADIVRAIEVSGLYTRHPTDHAA